MSSTLCGDCWTSTMSLRVTVPSGAVIVHATSACHSRRSSGSSSTTSQVQPSSSPSTAVALVKIRTNASLIARWRTDSGPHTHAASARCRKCRARRVASTNDTGCSQAAQRKSPRISDCRSWSSSSGSLLRSAATIVPSSLWWATGTVKASGITISRFDPSSIAESCDSRAGRWLEDGRVRRRSKTC